MDLNATQAAIRAGYSDKTAYSMGQRLLKNVEIQAAIQDAMEARQQRTEITQDMVVRELAAIGFARASDFIHIRNGRVIIDDTDSLTDAQKGAIAGIKEGKYGVEVRLHDKIRALEKLGEHLGMFQGKTAKGLEDETEKNKYGVVLMPALVELPPPPEEEDDG